MSFLKLNLMTRFYSFSAGHISSVKRGDTEPMNALPPLKSSRRFKGMLTTEPLRGISIEARGQRSGYEEVSGVYIFEGIPSMKSIK